MLTPLHNVVFEGNSSCLMQHQQWTRAENYSLSLFIVILSISFVCLCQIFLNYCSSGGVKYALRTLMAELGHCHTSCLWTECLFVLSIQFICLPKYNNIKTFWTVVFSFNLFLKLVVTEWDILFSSIRIWYTLLDNNLPYGLNLNLKELHNFLPVPSRPSSQHLMKTIFRAQSTKPNVNLS